MARPRVTCVIPSYDYGGYIARALDSVFAQTYPRELIEIVVVDDGSTDDTADVVRAYGDSVRYVHKENGGLNSAVDRGIAEATGDLIAILDADDTWPEDKVERQVALLESRPEVGLVYGDMEVIDADDALVNPSFFAMYGLQPLRGAGAFGSLMRRNVVSGGSAMFRASLKDAYHPIGAESAFPDWWIAAGIARVAEIEFLPEPANRYRLHGDNMGFGVQDDAKLLRVIHERELPFRRWMLAGVAPGEATSDELLAAFAVFAAYVNRVGQGLLLVPDAVLPVTAADRARSAARLEDGLAARAEGDFARAACRLVNALAHDPWNASAAQALETVHEDLTSAGVAASGARGFIIVAYAEELADHPPMLAAYGDAFGPGDDATLLIVARDWSGEEAMSRLEPAVAAAGLDSDDAPDLLVHVAAGPEEAGALAHRAHAVYSRAHHEGERFDEARVADLRALAERHWAPAR